MILKKLLSAILSASLTAAVIPLNFSVNAAYDQPPVNADEYVNVSTIEEAGEALRKGTASKEMKALIRFPYKLWNKDTNNQIIAEALKETSSGFNGDYWRYYLNSTSFTGSYTKDYVYISDVLHVYTSYEHDIEVRKRCSAVIARMQSELIELKNSGNTITDYNYEKLKWIHSYIKDNVKIYEPPTVIYDTIYDTAYSALVKGTATSGGIAQLFYVLAKETGFDCRIICGIASGDISFPDQTFWNIVGIDGKYYHVDTAMDMIIGNDSTYFFLNGKNDLNNIYKTQQHYYDKSHLFSVDYTSKEFKAAYPISEARYPAVAFDYGDINSSKTVDAVDASSILTYYAETSVGRKGSFTDTQRLAADVNRNGTIDSVDASLVLSYYAASSVRNVGTISEYISKRR